MAMILSIVMFSSAATIPMQVNSPANWLLKSPVCEPLTEASWKMRAWWNKSRPC